MSQTEAVKDHEQQDAPPEEAADRTADEPAAEEVADGASEERTSDGHAEEIEALEAERDEVNDRLLRTAAELQNVRRRAEREKARLATAGKTRVLRPLLEVLDDFERTLDAVEQYDEQADAAEAYRSLHEGVELVFRKLADELARLGVEHIEAEGVPFDEDLHEAVMQQPAPADTAPGTVLNEVQKGYRLKSGRVLRHSKVVVAS